jgi:hypothetical protein
MANSIALAQKYLPLLDEIYKAESKSAILDSTNVKFLNANTIQVFKTSMDGLGNYDRNTGFVPGDVTGTWESMTLQRDRGRTFMIDRMDNEETIDMAFGTLVGEFLRTKVVPEIDAYTFAKLAGWSGIDAGTAADVTIGTTDVPGLIDEATRSMGENEVPKAGRLLFISESAYAGLRAKIVRTVMNDVRGINREIDTYDEMPVIRVPQSRFYTAVTLYDGKTSGQTAGGYIGTTGAYKINFMIVHPSAIVKATKHVLPRIFTPDENQTADAWKFDYRVYHDTFAYANKVKGIYLHRGATALA